MLGTRCSMRAGDGKRSKDLRLAPHDEITRTVSRESRLWCILAKLQNHLMAKMARMRYEFPKLKALDILGGDVEPTCSFAQSRDYQMISIAR